MGNSPWACPMLTRCGNVYQGDTGKHEEVALASRLAVGSNAVVLPPANAAAFPTSEAVNERWTGCSAWRSRASDKPVERTQFSVGGKGWRKSRGRSPRALDAYGACSDPTVLGPADQSEQRWSHKDCSCPGGYVRYE